ncbi:hypothetical protein BGK67_31605 [Streptomyces subrutilus]|uniref:Uncharacterized protein n=1 Tax=Streptomyces subrutilus TaxID=36818 RepID=A0A1E5Q0J4_9ACTN|nr:hypothetical protein [Streptomyces subrutilus]OEJ35246.1 hypothetical protein BGK67_31605 [Streptomyces subrutilus]
MPRPWRDSSFVTESTGDGMSSVTTSTTQWLKVQAFSSTAGVCTRTFAVPRSPHPLLSAELGQGDVGTHAADTLSTGRAPSLVSPLVGVPGG